MFGCTRISAISRNGGRCEVFGLFFCDTNIWSFIGVYGIWIWALKNMIRLFFYVTVGPTVVIDWLSELLFFQVFSNSINKGANLFWEITGVNMFGLGSISRDLETVLEKFHVDESE